MKPKRGWIWIRIFGIIDIPSTEGRTTSYPTLYPYPFLSKVRTGCSCVRYNCTCAVMLFDKIQLSITACHVASPWIYSDCFISIPGPRGGRGESDYLRYEVVHSGMPIGNWYPWMRGGWSVSKPKQINLWIVENAPDQIFIPSSHLFLPTLYPMFHTICPVL